MSSFSGYLIPIWSHAGPDMLDFYPVRIWLDLKLKIQGEMADS